MAITRQKSKKNTPLCASSISSTIRNYRASKAQAIKNIDAWIKDVNSPRTLYDDQIDDIKKKERVEQNKIRLNQIRGQKRQYFDENVKLNLIIKQKDAEIVSLNEKFRNFEALLFKEVQNMKSKSPLIAIKSNPAQKRKSSELKENNCKKIKTTGLKRPKFTHNEEKTAKRIKLNNHIDNESDGESMLIGNMFQNYNITESDNDSVTQKQTFHKRIIEITKDIRTYCKLCSKSLILKNDMPMHVLLAHDQLKLRCNLCLFKTDTIKKIKLHERHSHEKGFIVQVSQNCLSKE